MCKFSFATILLISSISLSFAQSVDSTIYDYVPVPGHYSTGRDQLLNEIGQELSKTKFESIDSLKGKIIAQFILEQDSTLSDLRIHRSPNQLITESIYDYLTKPRGYWIPGLKDSSTSVRTKMTIIIPYSIPAYIFPKDHPDIENATHKGGLTGYLGFLRRNLKFPKNSIDRNVDGKVSLLFIVEKNGKISNPKVINGVGQEWDKEALRVIKLSEWIPATKGNAPVRQYMTDYIRIKTIRN